MNMWEDAPRAEVFGLQIYTFGIYCMIGACTAYTAILILCRQMKMKKGTGTLLFFISCISGVLASRLFFSVLYSVSMDGFPFYAWFRISTGGWSLFGLIFGVFSGAWICAGITKQEKGKLLDVVSCSLPLFIAAERFSERFFEGFDISRPIKSNSFPSDTFLAIKDNYYKDISFLATYLTAAIAAIVMFLILVFFLTSKDRREGDLWILFMILCGAGGIILESLRYDHYLEYSFVCFQQILAAVLFIWGIAAAGIRYRRAQKGVKFAAYISLPLAIGICGGIEYALDRTTISHVILYIIMAAAVSVPVTFGIIMLTKREKNII